MSNPATQNATAAPSNSGTVISDSPRTAIQAAMGASINDAPNQKWARLVNRLASEYPRIKSRTGPHRYSGQGLGGSRNRKIRVEATNPPQQTSVNIQTVR